MLWSGLASLLLAGFFALTVMSTALLPGPVTSSPVCSAALFEAGTATPHLEEVVGKYCTSPYMCIYKKKKKARSYNNHLIVELCFLSFHWWRTKKKKTLYHCGSSKPVTLSLCTLYVLPLLNRRKYTVQLCGMVFVSTWATGTCSKMSLFFL